jgi:hypothetical protein
MREDEIRIAIVNLEPGLFERFARELLSRNLYPGLNPTSQTHDFGEDARTEPSTIFLHSGLWISLNISKEGTWVKVERDCKRCRETERKIDILVFVTSQKPRTDTIEEWKIKVKGLYGWDLEVHTIEFLAPFANRPQYEDLVYDYLHIPPHGGDLITNIDREFKSITNRNLDQIKVKISTINLTISRDEVERIEDFISDSKPVLLYGEPGSGKSGIASILVENARMAGKIPLLIDARQVADIRSETDLRKYLALNGAVFDALDRLGNHKNGCRLIIDQLDSLAGLRSANVLVDLACESSHSIHTETIVILRNREGHENDLFDRFTKEGFQELKSHPISEEKVIEVFKQLKISDNSHKLIELGQNLLNLELIGVLSSRANVDFETIMSDLDLWEQYFKNLLDHETITTGRIEAQKIISEAVKLARVGLNNENGYVEIPVEISYYVNRLISWGIIFPIEGQIYRFQHEEMQSYCYAVDATNRNLPVSTVLKDINPYKTKSIIQWMLKIYEKKDSIFLSTFIKDVFNV